MRCWIPLVLFLLVLASGCLRDGSDIPNETTEYEYQNTSGNWTPPIPSRDFTFTTLRGNEFWIMPNRSVDFYVVFNNVDDDEETHEFVACRQLTGASTSRTVRNCIMT
jgi:hypothetical protein